MRKAIGIIILALLTVSLIVGIYSDYKGLIHKTVRNHHRSLSLAHMAQDERFLPKICLSASVSTQVKIKRRIMPQSNTDIYRQYRQSRVATGRH